MEWLYVLPIVVRYLCLNDLDYVTDSIEADIYHYKEHSRFPFSQDSQDIADIELHKY